MLRKIGKNRNLTPCITIKGETSAVLTWYVWGYKDAAARRVPPVTALGRRRVALRRVRVRVRRVRVSIRRRVSLVQRRYWLLKVLLLLLLHLDYSLKRLLVARIVLVHFLPRLCAKWKWNILREGTWYAGSWLRDDKNDIMTSPHPTNLKPDFAYLKMCQSSQ